MSNIRLVHSQFYWTLFVTLILPAVRESDKTWNNTATIHSHSCVLRASHPENPMMQLRLMESIDQFRVEVLWAQCSFVTFGSAFDDDHRWRRWNDGKLEEGFKEQIVFLYQPIMTLNKDNRCWVKRDIMFNVVIPTRIAISDKNLDMGRLHRSWPSLINWTFRLHSVIRAREGYRASLSEIGRYSGSQASNIAWEVVVKDCIERLELGNIVEERARGFRAWYFAGCRLLSIVISQA